MADTGEPWRPYVVGEDSPPPNRRLRLLSSVWADEITIDLDDTGLVDGLVPRTGITILYGASHTGKTFWTIHLAGSIAAGVAFYGMHVEQGIVVYVAAEASDSVRKRVKAWQMHNQVEHLPLLVIETPVNLMTEDAEALAAHIDERLGGERPILIIIDTMAASMQGDENSGQDMTIYFSRLRELGARYGSHILVVHHSGKDEGKGARGWSGIRGAADVELECRQGSVTATKVRDGKLGTAYGYKLTDVELGTSSSGRTIKTAVAEPLDEAPKETPKPEKLIPRHKTVLDCLGTAIADHGETLPRAHDIPPGTRGVALERWLDASLRYLPDRKGNGSPLPEFARRQAFMRCVEALQAKGLVKHVDGWCWPG